MIVNRKEFYLQLLHNFPINGSEILEFLDDIKSGLADVNYKWFRDDIESGEAYDCPIYSLSMLKL